MITIVRCTALSGAAAGQAPPVAPASVFDYDYGHDNEDERTRPLYRITYIIPSLSMGGTERQLICLMRGLAHEADLTVICTHGDGVLGGEARRLGAHVHIAGDRSGWDFRMRRAIYRLLMAHRPNIVHTFLFGFDLFANQAARDAGIPVVLSSRRELATWSKRRHIWLQRKANTLVDCIVANSQSVADYAIAREGADPALYRVIPNGIHADDFVTDVDPALLRRRYNIPFHRHIVGIVANFSPVKDHELFVAAAAALLRQRADVHFLMVGAGPLAEHIAHLTAKKGIQDCFTRITTASEIDCMYAMMDVSVLCSKAEGFPNAVIESMAARRPVVAAATGGIPELVQDGVTGRLVTTRDPQDFANAISWALDHPAEAGAMVQRAEDFVRRELSIEKMVGRYRELYSGLLGQ